MYLFLTYPYTSVKILTIWKGSAKVFLYDTLNNTVHMIDVMTPECKISQKDKSHCVIVNSLRNVDEQGLFTKLEKPRRCPYCMPDVD